MEALLEQVRLSDREAPVRAGKRYDFDPEILSFSGDAVSPRQRSFNKYQRFVHAEATLSSADPEKVRGRSVIVLDDVATTGAAVPRE